MPFENERSGLQLRTMVTKDGFLKLSLQRVETPEPAAEEVLVRVTATPIHPSDLVLLLGPADLSTAKISGEGADSVMTAAVPATRMPGMALRLDESLPVGNEGAGIVVKAGSSQAAQALMGKAVAMIGGAMFAEYRCIKAAECLVLPEGITPADGASSLVNPLTALSMVKAMALEGHTALVHTAAASSLGQILNRICLEDRVNLVNIVRSKEQEILLHNMGAKYVCNSTATSFMEDLTAALAASGATLAFDAVGGGKLAGQILNGMEAAANKKATSYNRYGSSVHKQVYIYGGLDPSPTELNRGFGMSWGIAGWLVSNFLQKAGLPVILAMRARIVAGLKTTFASSYAREISLLEAIQPNVVAEYSRRSTGEKYLINPGKDIHS